jgi:hypothetical protein
VIFIPIPLLDWDVEMDEMDVEAIQRERRGVEV